MFSKLSIGTFKGQPEAYRLTLRFEDPHFFG